MVGKTERTIKHNVIGPIEDLVGAKRVKYGQDGIVKIDGRKCLMVGANDARAEGKIRGGTFALGYGDEISLLPEAFFKMFMSRLSVPRAKLFGTTNPDSPYHWLKRDYLDKDDLDLIQFHFVLEDNPHLPPEYIQSLKREYKGLWAKRFILGLWCQAEGAVYADAWDEEECTFVGYSRQQEWWAAGDYGTTNPTTFGLYARDSIKTERCFHEYWWDSRAELRQKTDAQYVADWFKWLEIAQKDITADARAAGLAPPNITPAFLKLDPAAASLRVAFEQAGVKIEKANNDVVEGIKHVAGRLSLRKFLIHKRCVHSIREMDAYVWDSKSQERGEDAPVKTNDHTQDRHRYALYAPTFKPDARTTAQVRR